MIRDYLIECGIAPEVVDARLPLYEVIEIVPGAWLLRDGMEIHHVFDASIQRRLVARKAYREVMARLLKEHEMITTRTPINRPELASFAERAGFTKTWQDHQWQYFVLESVPFERKSTCPQP